MTDINDKPLLAFDCSVPVATIALRVRGVIHTRTLAPGSQAAQLVPAIQDLLRSHQVAFADLGGLLTTIGPGSFTGLRIGLAALHAFALAHGLPVRTTTSLQAAAWAIATHAPFTIALNAGKGEVFHQRFDEKAQPLGDILLSAPEPLLSQADCFSNLLSLGHTGYVAGPEASALCTHAADMQITEISNALPLYIRPPDAKPPAPLPWLQTT